MKKKITLLSLLLALFLLPINGFAYTINNEFNLGANEGSPIRTNPNYIVAQILAFAYPDNNLSRWGAPRSTCQLYN